MQYYYYYCCCCCFCCYSQFFVYAIWHQCSLLSVAGILRYQVDFQTMELPDDIGNDFDLDDY